MKSIIPVLTLSLLLAGCASTSIQPLTRTSFKIATVGAHACGSSGTRSVAFKAAAIEVINRGGDRFIVVGDQSSSTVSGGSFNTYGGYTTYSSNSQDMVIVLLSEGDADYDNGLSARETLGVEWRSIVEDGAPNTC